MTFWQFAQHEERCGFGWCLILPGEPVQVLTGTAKRRVRCCRHALGGPVDPIAIEAACLEPGDHPGVVAVAVNPFPRLVRERAQPARVLPFDGKLAALGEDR